MDADRLLAWDHELTRVHERLRAALVIARGTVEDAGPSTQLDADLQTFCLAFCSALDGHHRSEDAQMFPALLAQVPDLADVVTSLRRDHDMLTHLIGQMQLALADGGAPEELHRHLDGIEAVMETHFRYEERMLLAPLRELRRGGPPSELLGPLA